MIIAGCVVGYIAMICVVAFVAAMQIPERSYDREAMIALPALVWPLGIPILLCALAISRGTKRGERRRAFAEEREREARDADRLLRSEGLIP